MYLEPPITDNRTPIRRKTVGQALGGGLKVFAERRAIPFAELRPRDLLDTMDLCRIYGCSKRTVYRWVAEHDLVPTGRAGREYFFEKKVIVGWHNKHRPRPGRNLGS